MLTLKDTVNQELELGVLKLAAFDIASGTAGAYLYPGIAKIGNIFAEIVQEIASSVK